MKNTYVQLREKQQREFNEFPIAFAFSNEQFKSGMNELGLEVDDTDKITTINGSGFIRKTDIEKFENMLNEFDKEEKEKMQDDQYLYDMFIYELGNHEYGITYDLEPTLNALGLTFEDISSDERLAKVLKEAKSVYLKEFDLLNN